MGFLLRGQPGESGEAPLLVLQSGSNEILLPFAAEFLQTFDVAGRCIEMTLPEGLLDLDAPLSGEEKQRQKNEADEARAAGEVRKGK